MPSPDIEAPKPSDEEKALMREQLKILKQQQSESAAMEPFLLARLGFKKGGEGEFIPLTEEEKLLQLTSGERQLQEIQGLQGERLLSALKGELPVDPGLEQNLVSEESNIREMLSRKLGPQYEQTTSGIRTLSEMSKRHEALRSATRRGEIDTGTGLLLSQMGGMSNQGQMNISNYSMFPERSAGIFGRFGQAQQPYQMQRQMQFQANIQNAQNGGLFGTLGSLTGGLIGGGVAGSLLPNVGIGKGALLGATGFGGLFPQF